MEQELRAADSPVGSPSSSVPPSQTNVPPPEQPPLQGGQANGTAYGLSACTYGTLLLGTVAYEAFQKEKGEGYWRSWGSGGETTREARVCSSNPFATNRVRVRDLNPVSRRSAHRSALQQLEYCKSSHSPIAHGRVVVTPVDHRHDRQTEKRSRRRCCTKCTPHFPDGL